MIVNTNMQEAICRMQYFIAQGLIQDLNRADVPYAVIKGCPLAYYKTGNPGTRISSDIDILIPRQELNKVIEILKGNEFESTHPLSRAERVMLVSNSHQLPSFYKKIKDLYVQIDINFDLFWGEYTGERIEVSEFLQDTVEVDIFGCKVQTLPPLKTMMQVILHHYKEMNSIYHLTGHIAISKRAFEDIYILWQRYKEEMSVEKLCEISSRYAIFPYVYYILYYTQKVYGDEALYPYLDALKTAEGEALLECYGLTEEERKNWKIRFEERLDADVAKLVYHDLSHEDLEKLERSRRIFG